MNINETTSDTLQKTLTAPVSFFCEEKKEIFLSCGFIKHAMMMITGRGTHHPTLTSLHGGATT